jgi:sulfopyruvate decarboxylase subunit alpha
VATTNLQLQTRWAAGVCAGIRASGCRHVVYVPDNPLSHVLRTLDESFPEVTTLVATREEEAFGIAAGLYLGGRRPTVMLQSSGIGNSLNALTSLLIPYQIPALMVVSMRGDSGEWNAAQVPMGRAVRGIFDSIGVPHATVVAADAAAETVRLAGNTAFGTRTLGACLLPRSLTLKVP